MRGDSARSGACDEESSGNRTSISECYGLSNSPLRRMSEVRHSILGRLQSLPQRVLPRSHCCWLTGGIHAVLLLREISNRQSMEVERGEDL